MSQRCRVAVKPQAVDVSEAELEPQAPGPSPQPREPTMRTLLRLAAILLVTGAVAGGIYLLVRANARPTVMAAQAATGHGGGRGAPWPPWPSAMPDGGARAGLGRPRVAAGPSDSGERDGGGARPRRGRRAAGERARRSVAGRGRDWKRGTAGRATAGTGSSRPAAEAPACCSPRSRWCRRRRRGGTAGPFASQGQGGEGRVRTPAADASLRGALPLGHAGAIGVTIE